MQESEILEKIALDFKAVQANKSFIRNGLIRAAIKGHLDATMLLEFFDDYFIIPFQATWQEIQRELGTSEEDSRAILDIWEPSKEGLYKIIKWGSQGILQYYLA